MSKQKKTKIILGLFIFLLGSVFAIYFTIYLHTLLSRGVIDSNIFKMEYIINTLKENLKVKKLFYYLELLVLLGSIFYVVKNDRYYESDLVKITPDISIPVEAGQKQFGSARFMTEEEKEIFGVAYLKKDATIKKLINLGYDDLENLKGGEKDKDVKQKRSVL